MFSALKVLVVPLLVRHRDAVRALGPEISRYLEMIHGRSLTCLRAMK